jgi:hypothetical protein
LLQSDKVDRLTDFERGVWIVSRLACDDFGVMRASANTLQGAARFLERKPLKTVQRALVAVERVGLLQSFEFEGRAYVFQADWQDWQKVTYPRGTLHPKPPAEMLAICSSSTQELFSKHPGGWGRRKSETLANGSANVPKTDPEPLRKRSENVLPKPLAVSQEPLAVSRTPRAGVALAPFANSLHRGGHQRHAWCSERICVPDFTHERLCRQKGGPLAEAGAWLSDWYLRVIERIGDAPIGDKPEDFWPRQFAAEFPPSGGVSKLTAALEKASQW